MERPNTLKFMALFLLLSIIMPLVYFGADARINAKKENFLKNGTPVTCTVTSARKFIYASRVTCYYFDNFGQTIYTETVLHKTARVGESFEAYVLPGNPYIVFDPKYSISKNIFSGSVVLTSVIGWLLMILYLYDTINYKLLSEAGKETNADLMSIERWDSNTLYGSFRFIDERNKPCSATIYISSNLADVYETYRICYYEKANGTILAATADPRLQKQNL